MLQEIHGVTLFLIAVLTKVIHLLLLFLVFRIGYGIYQELKEKPFLLTNERDEKYYLRGFLVGSMTICVLWAIFILGGS